MDNGLASAIKSCRDLDQARQLHRQWERAKESSGSVYLGNLLIETYGKCGHPDCSRQVFDTLRLPNTFSWNLLISAYARNGFLHEAQELFAAMSPPSLVAANVMITAYARKGHVAHAKNVYDTMLEHSSVSWSAMITALVSTGNLDDACDLLEALPERDTTCSNLVIAAYAQAGHFFQARHLFDEMRHRDIATWNTMLGALAGAGEVTEMERFFETMMPGWSAASLTILVTSLARHGRLDEARVAFETRPQLHDLVSWTALLAGFALHGNDDIQECEAIFFHKMPLHNHVSWTMMLAAYARHTHLSRRASKFFHENLPRHSIASSNTAMGICVHAGKMDRARDLFDAMELRDAETWDLLLRATRADEVNRVFERMPEHTPLSWAARITAAVASGHPENALAMLDSLPDHHHLESWTMLVKCFGEQGFLEAAKAVFETRMPLHDRVSSTVMLLVYARHGHFVPAKAMLQSLPDRDMESWNSLLNVTVVDEALKVFQRMPARDVVSWTSMLTSYVQAGRAEEALHLYRSMNLQGERINRVTLVAAIDACADAAAIADGQAIHFGYAANELHCWPDARLDARVENSLLSMYGRCGSLAQATALFAEMRERRDLVSWNTMITAYSQRQSRANTCAAVETFQRMNQDGVHPNDITFTALLSVCSRSGWLDAAWSLFHTMIADFGLAASTRHIVCMVDLLGRAGKLDDAERAIRGASLAELGVAWRTLLAASEVHGNANTGARAAKHVASSSTCSSLSPAYILLSNLLTTS